MSSMVKYMKKYMIVLAVISLVAIVLAGCDNSSGPSTTELSEGSGYRMKISISNDTLPSGGSTIVTAVIFDETGQPAADDDDGVFFSFGDKGGEWDGLSNGMAKLKGGTAVATLKWEDPSSGESADPARTAWISVAYRGAVGKIEVDLVSNTF